MAARNSRKCGANCIVAGGLDDARVIAMLRFHFDSNIVRPGGQPGWTSADAAGLPIFPGLARYEEAARGPGGVGVKRWHPPEL